MNKTLLGAVVIALALSLTACGGSTTTVKQTETQGQQLMDLKEAYDKGVITEKEYNSTKKKILKSG
ncbi:MAG: SHOCT domain-containing protein [Proteobacteria bacterium]|nr:SHOCT domain-containing protein [Pseudomonadota bacterium]